MAGGAYRLDEVAVRLDGGAGGTDVPLPVAVASGGTGADLSTIAKGGLLVGTGAGTIGIKAVGTNTQVLTADDTAAGGVKWAAAGGISGLTTNTIPKATSATAIGNSSVTDNGTTLTLGNAGVTVTEATGALTLTAQAVGTTPLAVAGASGQTASLLTVTGGATPGAAYAPMVAVTGTLPASPSAAVSGVSITATGAGSAAQSQRALTATLAAGATGAASSYAGYFDNASAHSGAMGAAGVLGAATSAGSVVGIGVWGKSSVAPAGYAVVGDTESNAGAWTNIGVMGRAYTGANNHRFGGLFRLDSGSMPTGRPDLNIYNGVAALAADNSSVASPIFLARDNGTTVFSVEDAGYLTSAQGGSAGTVAWGVPAASPQAYVHRMAASSSPGTHTNTVGANATIESGNGTGNATGSSLIFRTPTATTTGTDAQTQTTRLTIDSTGITPAANFKLPFGAIYWSSPAATSNEAATPIKAAGTTAAQGNAYEVTQAATNRLTYIGTTTRDFLVMATVTLTAAATNTNSTVYIYKGGSAVTGLEIDRYITTSDAGAVAIHGVVSLATNEYVELWTATDDGDDLTVQHGVVSIRALN